MSCVCACDQRRRCLENRPIDLEPWIKFSTRTASCFYSLFSIHRHRRDVCYLKSSSANVYKKKKHLCIMWRFSVSINCNLVWIFLNGWFYFGDDDRGVGRGGLVVKVCVETIEWRDWTWDDDCLLLFYLSSIPVYVLYDCMYMYHTCIKIYIIWMCIIIRTYFI